MAARTCSILVPLSMVSRILCEPDSTPSHTSSAPAAARFATTGGFIRLTRDCIEKGILAFRAATSLANASIHGELSPKMSSANHTWSGATDSRNRLSSSATFAGLR